MVVEKSGNGMSKTFQQLFFVLATIFVSTVLGWQDIRKAPYLIYNGNPGEMVVLWQMNKTLTCTIRWGEDTTFSDGVAQTSEYNNDHQHKYVISNLVPGNLYHYEVIAGVDTFRGSFRAAPEEDVSSVKFFVYGDTRSYPETHNRVARGINELYEADSSFHTLVISVGDLVSNGDSEDYWDEQFFNPSYPDIIKMLGHLPYQACMGNHEKNGVLFEKYFPYPFVGGRYWSFDYGPAHFVILDQYTGYDPGSVQYEWLVNDLASTGKKWKFIVLHEPGYTAGGKHPNNVMVQNYIHPLCTEYGVSIVFAGHNHFYSRAEVGDVVHITTGGGGAPLYSPVKQGNVVVAAMENHFCTVEISDKLLHFRSISDKGEEIDRFSLNVYKLRPYDVSVSQFFAKKGKDSLIVLSRLRNPFNRKVGVYTVLCPFYSAKQDSFAMFDDGSHGDDGVGDGLWGCGMPVPDFEDEFEIAIAVIDSEADFSFLSYDQSRFTTIGPVVLEKFEITSSDTVPNHGDRLKFQFVLKNTSEEATARDVTAKVSCLDTFATLPVVVTSSYGDIPPGTAAVGDRKQYIKFSNTAPDSAYARFRVDIMSGGSVFWVDSFSVLITRSSAGIGE